MTEPDNLCIELSTFLQQLENEIESFSTESKI